MKELKELLSQRKYIFKKGGAHRQTGHGGGKQYAQEKSLRVGNGTANNGGIRECYAVDMDGFFLALAHPSQEPPTMKGDSDG